MIKKFLKLYYKSLGKYSRITMIRDFERHSRITIIRDFERHSRIIMVRDFERHSQDKIFSKMINDFIKNSCKTMKELF